MEKNLQERLDEGLQDLIKKLEKNNGNPFTAEQYKLLLDSSQKTEERKKDIHSFFITINAIFLPVLVNLDSFNERLNQNIFIFIILTSIGVFLCLDWIWIIGTYKKINYVNNVLVSAFEEYLPTSIFSLKAAIIDPRYEYKRANVLTQKETVIPFLFLIIYLLYFFMKVFSG